MKRATLAMLISVIVSFPFINCTLHTLDAVQTIQRIYGTFPADQQNNITYQISNSLQAIIAQNLLPRADGKGQVLACEICIATPAIRKLIRDGESHLWPTKSKWARNTKCKIWICPFWSYTNAAKSPTTPLCRAHEIQTYSATRRPDEEHVL
jgi:Tfp pilus assembly ATPase PilU